MTVKGVARAVDGAAAAAVARRIVVLVVAVGSFGDGLSEVPTAARSR